ncbi:hypothetical protein ACFLYW_02920 [Thermodesulfobacteriota bacterium]
MDPPHNPASGVYCGDCHSHSLVDPQTCAPIVHPFWDPDAEAAVYNLICLRCHIIEADEVGPDGYFCTCAPVASTHDPNGDEIKCTVCHHPHMQEQMDMGMWDQSNFLIAEAELDTDEGRSIRFTTGAIVKTVIPYKNYSDYNVTDNWTDQTSLAGKTNPKRGALLAPNTLDYSRWPLYMIDAVDEHPAGGDIGEPPYSTITVKGEVTETVNRIGFTYGQLVRYYLFQEDPPTLDFVPYREKTGLNGLAYNENAPGDDQTLGICQVCHTDTDYWSNDGKGTDHNPDRYCIDCHSHSDGFLHGGGDGTGCDECHGHDPEYDGYTGGAGTFESHSTHTENDNDDKKGPNVECDVCHDTTVAGTATFPYFKSGTGDPPYDLSETTVCDNCHSKDGDYDGVDDSVIGAKANWSSGIYDRYGDGTSTSVLQAGKEKWCATCHDGGTSIMTGGVSAPNVIGDEGGSYIFGTGWGYYKTGHGLAADEPYPYKGVLAEPPLVGGAAKPIECDSCHDFSTAHIDGESRTFNDNGDPLTDSSEYRIGYRLKLVSGQEPMHIPWKGPGSPPSPPNNADRYRLCATCHEAEAYTTSGTTMTNLVTDGVNRHTSHLNDAALRYAADWDGGVDGGSATSRMTCVACHNVHGSTKLAMIRDGKLTGNDGYSREPGLMIWYKNSIVDFSTTNPDPPVPENITLAASDGTIWRGDTSGRLCSHCHHNNNTLGENRTPFQDVSQDPTLDWTGEAGYVIDGVEPDIGDPSSTSFAFSIKYTDANNDAPSNDIQLWIDRNDNQNYDDEAPIVMVKDDPGDDNYTDGMIYTFETSIASTNDNILTYYFSTVVGGTTIRSPEPDRLVSVSGASGTDNLSTSDPTAMQSGSVDAGTNNIEMLRIQVDCDTSGDNECILAGVEVEDIGTAASGDLDSLEIYIDDDENFGTPDSVLIGQVASWDGSKTTVYLDQETVADRTVTNPTSKYIFIIYDITEAAEGQTLQARVSEVRVLSPDTGVTGLEYDSDTVTVNGDTLTTSNNTTIESAGPYAGTQTVVMQRFQVDCGDTGNNSCILSDVTVSDLGTATTGDWDSLEIYIDDDENFGTPDSVLIGQASFDGTSTAVTLDQGTEPDRTVTNGTEKYIFIVYDINSCAEGKTIQNQVTGVGVESPDTGATDLVYNSNEELQIKTPNNRDNLSISNPTAVHSEYAAQGEGEAVMERFQVDCDTADDGDSNCILSSITVDDLGTASTGDWNTLDIYIDTDISFTGATLIGHQTATWDGTSTVIPLSLGTEEDRTVTDGTPKYVFVVYNLSDSIVVDTTLQSRVTAVGVETPDICVNGITSDSDVVTVKDAIYVGSGELYETIQDAVDDAFADDIIIVSAGTYTENVNHSPPSGTKALHIYSANGPENTIIDGNDSGRVVTLGYRSGASTLSGFTITNGSVASIGGAGIYVTMAQSTIDNCIITGNDAGSLPGGGIHVNHASSDLTLTNTIISSNNGGNGGGLYMPSGTNATIDNCVFDQNTGSLGGAIYFNAADNTTTIEDTTFTGNSSTSDGGAFYRIGGNSVTFSRCTITGNHSDTQGGVLRTGNASPATFENCIIADNYAPNGGVFSLNGGAQTLTNCTIADNRATTGSSGGGGILYRCSSGTIILKNSIAWNNTATSGSGHIAYQYCGSGNVGSATYSDIELTNDSGSYYRSSNITDGGNNIDPAEDPSFDAGGTYHLTSSSTNVIDAGTSSGAPTDDIDGDTRDANPDMGADEYIQ